MTRTLERRVVAVKEHFAADISAANKREERARSELVQCEKRESDLRERYNELVKSSNAQVAHLTARLEEVEHAKIQLERSEERTRSDIEATLHEQLESQRVKHTR